jgi:quercetin dioxygenase-like cupin family protein
MTRSNHQLACVLASLAVAIPACRTGPAQEPRRSGGEAGETSRVALSHSLPPLNGNRLKATMVEVSYDPGKGSAPHSHPCPVIGYVVSGALRSQVKGEPEAVYRAGEGFFEPANAVHLISANASLTEPVKFLAYFTCDHDAHLSVPVSDSRATGGNSDVRRGGEAL